MRRAWLMVCLGACSFDPRGVPAADDPDARIPRDDGSPDGPPSTIDGSVPDATPPDATPAATCPASYTVSTTPGVSAYRLVQGPQLTWGGAVADCANDGAPYTHLAVIGDPTENAYVDSFTSNRTVWIGISDIAAEGTWRDLDNAIALYTPWQLGEPSNGGDPQNVPGEDCGQFVDGGGWNDLPCTDTLRYLCECDP